MTPEIVVFPVAETTEFMSFKLSSFYLLTKIE